MTNSNHHDDAVATLGAIESCNAGLQAAYAKLHDHRTTDAEIQVAKRQVAELHDSIRRGFKRAEVLALLHVGERVDALVRTIDAQRLTPSEVDYLLAHPQTGV